MNFTLAQQRLQAEGIDTRVVFVTDDIASAPVTEIDKRRGIAGDFVVFKVAGAAAEAGYSLDEVERVARHANDRTRTLGVAFAGCTMPGASDSLFHVPPGQMGIGLGIHGEPGVSEAPLPRAADLAQTLVEGVLGEAPSDGTTRVGVILNGLGSTKYEELFVVWRSVARLLRDGGYTVVEPEVGELVTSLDMAGCSLTMVFLDEELEDFWRAPADTPAYRKGAAPTAPSGPRRSAGQVAEVASVVVEASEASRRASRIAVACLQAMKGAIDEAADELGRIDAVAGDGDHGRGMVKGVTAAAAAASTAQQHGGGVATVLAAAGEAWAAKAGGTSGVLWGAALTALGARLGDQSDEITPRDVAAAVTDGLRTLQDLGKAKVGDKTMLDALVPFVETLQQRVGDGVGLAAAWADAARVSEQAAQATANLRPQIGRARPLAERSLGTPDAGAVSMALCLHTVAAVLAASTTTASTAARPA
jgi:dihydroxyacetone kinase